MLWASMQAEYLIEDALESTDDSFDEFTLAMADLPFEASICILSETHLESAGLDMAEEICKLPSFFLNQQFITWGAMAVYNDYLVAIIY